ncbi:MAG: S-methyl-5'-thioadenosine phosphorylase [Candidatus Bathyarchaeota archaeon]|nr:S-methyl-5'-thioadenosine phosphorylase [Candidatus Bathyarchaeota archaeon]
MVAGKKAEIAIIGGSGLYEQEMLENAEEIKVYTPFGRTSDMITIGKYYGKMVAFLPRHAKGHQIPPHKINFRANIWALKELGVKRILSSNACGSLQEKHSPGDILVIDQFIDRTKSRSSTFFDGGQICHISAADPFCPELGNLLINKGKDLGIKLFEGGNYVCIEGPRFSTRAESRLFRRWEADVVGMTVFPECVLAREAEICYSSIALVTDYDVWAEKPVSVDEIISTMKKNVDKAKTLFSAVIPEIPSDANCKCWNALKDALI